VKNPGKVFEEDIMGSIPEKLFKYKLRDSASGWSGGDKARFTTNNICDLIVHDGVWLHLLECKSHKGTSIPTSPTTNEKGKITHYGVIKINQLDGLMKEHPKENVSAGFLFNLSDKARTYFVEVPEVYEALVNEGRKSLSLEWLGLHGVLIPQMLKGRSKIHWKYNLSSLLDNQRRVKNASN
jgi:recombination protein U